MDKQTVSAIAEYIFENRENVTEGFYVDIMKLLKNNYVNGNGLEEFHIFLAQNENPVTQRIISRFFPKQSYFGVMLETLSFIPFIF